MYTTPIVLERHHSKVQIVKEKIIYKAVSLQTLTVPMSLRCISATAPITRLLKNSTSEIMSFNENRRWVNHYAGPDTSVSVICDQFSKFEGGKVELTKDDKSGVAVIKINHPERRNALSGTYIFLNN